MKGRLYIVEDEESMSLIRAVSPTKALAHVVQSQYKVRLANAQDVADFYEQGGKVENTPDVLEDGEEGEESEDGDGDDDGEADTSEEDDSDDDIDDDIPF